MLNFNLTILVQMASFLVFAWLFNLVFFRPVVNHLAERNRYVIDQQAQAERLLKEATAMRQAQDEQLRAAQRQAQSTVEAALADARAKRAELLADATARGQDLVEAARVELASERDRLIGELHHEIAPLARSVAGKILLAGDLDRAKAAATKGVEA